MNRHPTGSNSRGLLGIVTRHFGEDRWDDLLDSTGLDGAYTSIGTYPDEQFMRMVKALLRTTGKSVEDTLRWFGRYAIPLYSERYCKLFAAYTSSRPLILGLNAVIHTQVQRLYLDANCPKFEIDKVSRDSILPVYRSA